MITEKESKMRNEKPHISRRELLKAGAAVSAGAILSPSSNIFAAGSDTMRIALIGCGSRGTQDTVDYFKSADCVEMVAMAVIFRDKLDSSLANIRKQLPDKVKVIPIVINICALHISLDTPIESDQHQEQPSTRHLSPPNANHHNPHNIDSANSDYESNARDSLQDLTLGNMMATVRSSYS